MARTREFDESKVLDKAMEVFWRHGYDGASMAELGKAMALTAPSIYAAFGSKRGLFDAVMKRYEERRAAVKAYVHAASTAREATERLLMGAADWLTDPTEPAGCLLVQGGVSAGTGNEEVPAMLSELRARVEVTLRARYEAALENGELPISINASQLARYYYAVFLGMNMQAAAGASKTELEEVARQAMAGWPLPVKDIIS